MLPAVPLPPAAVVPALDVVLVEAAVGIERAAQPFHELGVAGQRLVHAHADEVLAPMGEKRFGRGVGVGHVEVLVEQQHGGGEQLQARMGRHELHR